MAGGFCEHGRIWTTCETCGKDVISRARKGKKRAAPDDFLEEPVTVKPRVVKPPPDEPPPTEFEETG